MLHSHRKDLTPPTHRRQQRSGRNHAGEAAAVAFVPEFLPSIPFPKNSGATAIGGMIRTRSGLPRTHALIRRALRTRNLQRQRSASKHSPHEACLAARRARASRTLCTKAYPYAVPVLAVLHSHRKDLTTPLAAGSSGAGGIMPEKRQRSPLSPNFHLRFHSQKIRGQQRSEA
ncbi:hypothetical protein [Paenibacillus sp. SSG-1]|uniref:hypothetical protein n=2 Tax=Paenibacillus sp. SSG-1 TaxID=1443669 RepID=UPI001C52AEED|nr:hypothetical protein [Paenibacillus sp. SSG-1]